MQRLIDNVHLSIQNCMNPLGPLPETLPMEPLIPDPAPAPAPASAPRNGEIVLMMLTSAGDEYDLRDGKDLRRLALSMGIPTVTTVAGCKATAMALQAMRRGPLVQVSGPERMCVEGVDARKAKLSCCRVLLGGQLWRLIYSIDLSPLRRHLSKTTSPTTTTTQLSW